MTNARTAFLNMTSYYIQAYKSGTYPTVNQDQVYLWARPHPKNANAPDPTPKPTGYEMVRRPADQPCNRS